MKSSLRSLYAVPLIALACTGTVEQQQVVPLPPDMSSAFSIHSYAERFYMPAARGGTYRADVRFENRTEPRLRIDWTSQGTEAGAGLIDTDVALEFKPTAVARRRGTGNTLYVVGWLESSARVLIEEWVFSESVPDGIAASPTRTEPAISRHVVWTSESNTLPPIWDAACQVYANEVWLLDSNAPRSIWAVDLVSGAVSPRFSSAMAAQDTLAEGRSLGVGQHRTGGLVIYSARRRPWDRSRASSAQLVFVTEDSNLDGATDWSGALTYEDFKLRYPGPFDMRY
ncbi:MAG: hypothetical protein ACYTCU_03560 [Planctomycetota bacterium]|jgi:hypothetical protein